MNHKLWEKKHLGHWHSCPKGDTFHTLHVTNRNGNGLKSVQSSVIDLFQPGFCPCWTERPLFVQNEHQKTYARNRPHQYNSSEWVTKEQHSFRFVLKHISSSWDWIPICWQVCANCFRQHFLRLDSAKIPEIPQKCVCTLTPCVGEILFAFASVLYISLQASKSQAFFEEKS